MPQVVLDAFTREYGIQVEYLHYVAQEDAIAEMQAGEVYDVVVLENQLIPPAVEAGLLAEINYQNVPNFKNISANFRDLVYDPGNRHSVPYSWGTTGLAVAVEETVTPVEGWADIWNGGDSGKFVGWNIERYMIGMALKSLGFSINSEDPQDLELALGRLLELKPRLILVDWEPAITSTYILNGEAIYGMGQADDVVAGEESKVKIDYILPSEGAILWGDNWTIPSNSTHKKEAEQLINFLLRAEIAAQVINETYYWLPNDAALPLVEPELQNNKAIFPSAQVIRNAEIMLPLSPQGEALYAETWEQFLSAK
jgi:spermidine/putrescine transport system substrate-binding protein